MCSLIFSVNEGLIVFWRKNLEILITSKTLQCSEVCVRLKKSEELLLLGENMKEHFPLVICYECSILSLNTFCI